MGRTIAIVGTAASSRDEANYEPVEVERWGQGRTYTFLDRLHRFFELHTMDWIRKRASYQAFVEYSHWLKHYEHPVYMIETHPTVPTSVRYPIEKIIKQFGPYMTSSVSYMIALAIHEGCDEIKLFGVDMAAKMEYTYQRNGIEYLLGWAMGMGIKVTIPDSSPILKAPLYGREADETLTHGYLLNKLDALQARLAVSHETVRSMQAGIDLLKELGDQVEGVHLGDIKERLEILAPKEKQECKDLVEIRAQIKELMDLKNEAEGMYRPAKLPEGTPMVVPRKRSDNGSAVAVSE